MSQVETELKYEADDAAGGPPTPEGLHVVDDCDTVLNATYWDSREHLLLDWGITLRHRTAEDGSEHEWTLKVPVAKAGRGTSRREISTDGPPDHPPADLAHLIASIVSQDELGPVAELRTRRRIQVLGRNGGPSVVEMTDDRVEVVTENGSAPFREFEAELLDPADARALVQIERCWRKAGLRPSAGSKLHQALGGPRTNRRPPDRRSSTGTFVSHFIETGRRQLLENELRLRVEPGSTEPVHQARVATRRLRANLRTFRRMLDRTTTDHLRGELKWIGRLLGEVRDVQVRAQRLRKLTEQERLSGTGLEELEEVGVSATEGAERNLLSALDGDRYRHLITDLRLAVETPPVRDADQPVRPEVQRALRKRWKRIRGEVSALDDPPEDAALHEVRKHVKALRYGLQAAKPLRVTAPDLVEGLGVLQDRLGDLHDTVVIRSWIATNRDRLDGDAAFLAGQLDHTLATLHGELRRTWRDDWAAIHRQRVPRR
ncbi:MAG TPA: CYTH and CHAD domain-containing protein [Microthrixaceae bacterium]|nr:CYTH and CHAD domain-containing protein [Microthrixaceae bacterium]